MDALSEQRAERLLRLLRDLRRERLLDGRLPVDASVWLSAEQLHCLGDYCGRYLSTAGRPWGAAPERLMGFRLRVNGSGLPELDDIAL